MDRHQWAISSRFTNQTSSKLKHVDKELAQRKHASRLSYDARVQPD